MLRQVAVLKFELVSKNDNVVIRDVQLWKDVESHEQTIRSLKGCFLQYVDYYKLPLWITGTGTVTTCLTGSSTTLAYFTSKLRRERRGIVIETIGGYAVLYKSENTVQCLEIDLSVKSLLDSQINGLENSLVSASAKDNNIDVILRQSHQRQTHNNNKVMKNLQISEKKLQFNDTLSRLILGGLRLRGVPNSQFGFQKLYRMTFNAAEFAHRAQLQQQSTSNEPQVPFEELQATVETLLQLFTRS